MKNLKQMIRKYAEDDQAALHCSGQTVSVSAKIALEAKIKLEAIATLFCRKQTPLLAELIETSINEIFDQLHLPEELHARVKERMNETHSGKQDPLSQAARPQSQPAMESSQSASLRKRRTSADRS